MPPRRTITVSHTASQALLYVGFKHSILKTFTGDEQQSGGAGHGS